MSGWAVREKTITAWRRTLAEYIHTELRIKYRDTSMYIAPETNLAAPRAVMAKDMIISILYDILVEIDAKNEE